MSDYVMDVTYNPSEWFRKPTEPTLFLGVTLYGEGFAVEALRNEGNEWTRMFSVLGLEWAEAERLYEAVQADWEHDISASWWPADFDQATVDAMREDLSRFDADDQGGDSGLYRIVRRVKRAFL